MHRLLQGEVGSGKTVVALRAMLAVVDAGGQAALLAPTEVLAQQHHRSITAMLGDAGRGRACSAAPTRHQGGAAHRLHGRRGPPAGAARRGVAARRASSSAPTRCSRRRSSSTTWGWSWSTSSTGSASSSVTRCAARPSSRPHVLVMTATPIPRTVAMTVFGDLEVSTLTSCPRAARRSPPTSCPPPRSRTSWSAPGSGSRGGRAGHQAYVVCPRIGDDGEGDEAADVTRRRRRTRTRKRPPLAVARRAPSSSPRARSPGCGSRCCTAGCSPTRRTR